MPYFVYIDDLDFRELVEYDTEADARDCVDRHPEAYTTLIEGQRMPEKVPVADVE